MHEQLAFPCPDSRGFAMHDSGMTLRQWYAGQALAGMPERYTLPPDVRALRAFEVADAMIEHERQEGEKT